MLQYNPTVSGSLTITGSLTVTNGVIGTVSGIDVQIFSSSINQVITGIQSSTESSDARLSNIESKSASVDTSISNINSFTASNGTTSLNSKTGSYATTGSNSFYGTQVFSGSVFIANDLIVQGSSSIQYISASSVSIGTNIVQLNTDTPAVRFAGLTVQDSGSSAGVTGSMLWDSLCNRWIYSNPSTIGYSGGMLLSGPRTQTLGTEPTLTCNFIAKSGGGDHLYDSCIIDDGTTTCIKNNFVSTGTGLFCGQLNSITGVFGSKGGGNYGVLISDNDQSNVRLRFTNSGTGGQSMSIVGGNPAVSNSGLAIYDETAGATRLYINSSGCIGIGVACPANLLHLIGICSTPSLRLGSASISYYWDIGRENATSGDFIFINANPTTPIERMRITTSGNVGINTCAPSNLLHVEASNNTTNQFRVNSCDGLNAGLRSYTTSDGPGLLINHYYAASGSPYLRTSDFVSNQGDGASTQMRFFTKDFNANPALAMIITSGRSVGIGTDTPSLHSSSSGLVVKGIGARGIIEVWDGTSGKGVFQQVGGTTYIGNLDKGTSGGSLRFLINGSGTSATEAMVINCLGRVLINNTAAVGTGADYSRVTISGTCSKNQTPGVGGSILHLTSCETDYPFGLKFNIVGDTCNCLRTMQLQTGDHGLTNQGNITFQHAGGRVGIGTSVPSRLLEVNGDTTLQGNNYINSTKMIQWEGGVYWSTRTTSSANQFEIYRGDTGHTPFLITAANCIKLSGSFLNNAAVGIDTFTIDTMQGYQTIANGGYVDFGGMSGILFVNNWSNGGVTIWLMGGGNTAALGSVIAQVGTAHHNPGVGGYRWCNNYGSTANFGFQVFRTRNTA